VEEACILEGDEKAKSEPGWDGEKELEMLKAGPEGCCFDV
jgi:hypothetical protein